MKKGISLELAVIPEFLLMVAVIDVTGASSWQASSSVTENVNFATSINGT
jgi:hypothetical protein